jgi:hypothetical protein
MSGAAVLRFFAKPAIRGLAGARHCLASYLANAKGALPELELTNSCRDVEKRANERRTCRLRAVTMGSAELSSNPPVQGQGLGRLCSIPGQDFVAENAASS